MCGGTVAALATDIFDVVAQGLSKLDNVLCAVMLSSFQTIAEVGVAFIPGAGEAETALGAAVQGAKSFAQNGMKADKYFGDWIGKACGLPGFSFDITDVFSNMLKFPDSVGTSIGCKQPDPSQCTAVAPVPDNPKA